MNLVKNLAAAFLLAFALSVNVSAGDQHGPAGTNPPPPPATAPAEGTEKTEPTETQEPTLAEEFWVEALTTLLSFY